VSSEGQRAHGNGFASTGGAAAPLPKQHRERYIEEWYRELEEKPDGPVTRLIFGLPLLLRRASLARR
jgi:hypothetical protein